MGEKPKPKSKPHTKPEQRRRFDETAKEVGCDDGQALDAAFGKIVPPKVAKGKAE